MRVIVWLWILASVALSAVACGNTRIGKLTGIGGWREAKESVAELQKIHEVTGEREPVYAQYFSLLANAKAKTDVADKALGAGKLKTEIDAAMQAFTDAGTVWDWKMQNPGLTKNLTFSTTELGKTMAAKYPIRKLDGIVASYSRSADFAMQEIWSSASDHLIEAEKLTGP
jgi:hypothetical protein